MVKDLNHYMSLRYEIVVREMSAEDGGGVFLYISTLGGAAVNAWGATYSEARHILEEVKKEYVFEIVKKVLKNCLEENQK